MVERDTWLTTRDEAARRLVEGLDEESKEHVRATKKADLIQFHRFWGMGIRNWVRAPTRQPEAARIMRDD